MKGKTKTIPARGAVSASRWSALARWHTNQHSKKGDPHIRYVSPGSFLDEKTRGAGCWVLGLMDSGTGYTEAMRWVLWLGVCLLPCLAHGAVSAADVAREVREMSLDPGECYRVRDVALPKDEARFFFTDGYLIFAKPVAGVRMSAVFTADVEGGDAEVLVLPPNRGERRSLASYTGAPNLDEHLVATVLIFSDDTYAKLTEQIHQNAANKKSPEMGAMMAEHWAPVVRNIAASFQARLVWDVLLGEPQSHGFLAVSMSGKKLGNFDLYYDRSAREQIVMGKLDTRDNLLFFDVWTSFVARSFRTWPIEPDLTLEDFRIEATLQPDLTRRVVTRVKAKPGRATLPVLAFDVAHPMRISAALVDGKPAEVLQRESMRSELLRNVGNEMFLVVPPAPLERGREYELEFRHEGKVIFEAGNRVYYVGARANWFPNVGLQFAKYDLTFRYPKDLDLVTAGELVEEHEEGDWRITRRKTSAPIRIAGFNLGQYERVRLTRNGYTVEVCANRAIEPALAGKRPQAAEMPPGPRQREPEIVILPPELPPDPQARLQEIASEIASAVEFMAARFGPPALPTLTVAPVPGRFGQGFPGLIYLSTMSYLAPQNKAIQIGIHGSALRSAGAAHLDGGARPGAVRARLSRADLSFHDVVPGAAEQSHPLAGRSRTAVLLRYPAGARDRAPVVGQRGDFGGLSRRVADGGAGGLLGAAVPGEQERLAARGDGAGLL